MSDERVPRRVGLVGPDDEDALTVAREAVDRGGVTAVSGGARAMAAESGVDAVVAVGERALVDLARGGLPATVPVLPVGSVGGVGSVPRDAVERGVGSLLNGSFERVHHPVLSVSPLDDTRALFDLTLVSEEPARISEFTVRSGTERVDRFRADGVVVATPAGTGDYARAAGGPVVESGTGVVAVVPISPFATDTDHWVLEDSSVVLRVERDENPVELLADGRSAGRVVPGEPLRVEPAGELALAAVSGSRSAFDR